LITSIIFILFCVAGYSKSHNDYRLYINENEINLTYGIYELDGKQYIHIDDLTELFKDNVYYDRISGKLIITTHNNLVKLSKTDSKYFLKNNNSNYINLKNIIQCIDYNLVIAGYNIYLYNLNSVEGTIQKNRTELFDKQTGKVICLLSKQDKVKVILNEDKVKNNQKQISVETNIQGKMYYGYVLNKNVLYEYTPVIQTENNKKIILVKAQDKVSTSTNVQNIDMVAFDMYRLSGSNILSKLEYTNNTPQSIKVIATVNNGQKSSNYDSDIVSSMLNSDINRYEVIEQILKGVKNISGVNLDFSNFKLSDNENYIQFVKELAAMLHKNDKILIVNIPNLQNIGVNEISKFVDYIIIQPYSARTIASKTSGPISSIVYVEQAVQGIIKKVDNVNKVILEVPAYTILWTERRGTVINTEQYTMNTMEMYLKENKIQPKLDNSSGQNYVNYTKGITTYKMWLEDEYSITKKTEFVNKYGLAGLSIYKSGYEQKNIYTSILKILNK